MDSWLSHENPKWQYLRSNRQGHRIYAWQPNPEDPNYIHRVMTGQGHGGIHTARDLQYVKQRTRSCENAHAAGTPCPTLTCGAKAPATQVAETDAPDYYASGTEVRWPTNPTGDPDKPYWTTDSLYDEGQHQYEIRDQNYVPHPDLVPHQDLTPGPIQPIGHVANILDPVHSTLDPRVWDNPAAPEPTLKPEVAQWITQTLFEVLERHGYHDPGDWLTLVLTGSLTTYQYSDGSDVDISEFVDSERLPDWSRAEMISLMISEFDNVRVPGTPYPLQAYVVSPKLQPQDLYKPGLRSGYVVYGPGQGTWLVPPDPTRVHDVEHEMNDAYTVGLLACDKMDLLLRYEPDQAEDYWHALHKKRMTEQASGNGDYATSNVVYKMLFNRGLIPKIAELTGEHIASGTDEMMSLTP